LIGIVLGSAAALCIGLSLTGVVFLLLPEYRDRFAGEWRPLLAGIAWTGVLTTAAALSFVGELRASAWRRPAQGALAVFLAALLWRYWP
jgi:hypothetical protein